MKNPYSRTLRACYLGFITQAIAANFAPLLYLSFHTDYGIPLGRVALISTVFFITQLIVDVLSVKFADKIGYRRCVVASEVFSAAGLIGLAFLPDILADPFAGIIVSVIVYAMGSGLIEVLCSPIVEACPFDHKDAVMSLLHSFYCWGSVSVIVVSTLFFALFGLKNYRILACIWALVPIYNIFNFATCPIEHPPEDASGAGLKQLFKSPLFWTALIMMLCSGASELSMSQWASAFAEAALGLSKTLGDLLGPCLFACTMGLSRLIYGKFGAKLNLERYMAFSAAMCLMCYAAASLSSSPIIGLAGCVLCGFSVGIMWPGTISMTSRRIPLGGTAMFALMAMAGDLGGSLGPGLVGQAAQSASDNIRAGLKLGSLFPIIMIGAIAAMIWLSRKGNRKT